jgi:hypothetical protein
VSAARELRDVLSEVFAAAGDRPERDGPILRDR